MSQFEQLVRSNIRALKPYSSARSEFKGTAEVFLDANENPHETGLNRYPDPLQRKLKASIGEVKNVHPRHIFLGNGSDEAIDLLFRIFCEPKVDHVLTLPPTYGMYQVSAGIADVEVKEIPLINDFQLDVQGILSHANEQSKLLFICHPNNPTGNAMALPDIELLIQQFKGIVVVDEAYIDFAMNKSCWELFADAENLVVLQTFSKAWGMAGLRLGMAFANEWIINYFNKVKPPYNINSLTQETAITALGKVRQKEAWVDALLQQREWLMQALNQMEVVEKVFPSAANFLLLKVSNPRQIYDYLVENKIIVRDRSKVLQCEGCLRISVGLPEENQRLVESLSNYND